MNCNNKNVIKSIIKIAVLVVIFCLSIFKINAFSLMVQQDPIGIYCIKDNGMRAINEWVEIDFEGDNYLGYYFFDLNGYLIMNGITPDGYIVNERGQWIQNGVVQRKYYEINIPKQKVDKTKNELEEKRYAKYRKDGGSNLIIVILVVISLLFILAIMSTKSGSEHEHKNYDNLDYDINSNNKTHYNKNITTNNDTTVERSIWWYFRSDTDKKGEEGEDQVAEYLKYIGTDFIVLRNVNLPRTNNKPVQIDYLCVSKKGIFVIEVKNWLGEITGKYEDETWHSQIYDIINDQKNPIKQNEWHIDVLRRFIKQNMTYYSMVVFTDRAEIGRLDKVQNKTHIIKANQLNSKIHSIYEDSDVKSYNNYKSVAGYLRRFIV